MANGTSLSIEPSTIAAILKDLAALSRAATSLQKKIITALPAKTIDAKWVQAEHRVDRELKEKKVKTFSSMDEAISHLQQYT